MSLDSRARMSRISGRVFAGVTVLCCLPLVLTTAALAWKSAPLLERCSLGRIVCSTAWSPASGDFGMLSFIVGTACVTLLAMAIAVPVSLLAAIYLSEYCGRRVRAAIIPMVDLLSGIPSVVYGVVGTIAVVPAVAWVSERFGAYSSGYSLLAGGIVLAVMVCPFVINVGREVLSAVPDGMREASLSLGATKWQTVKRVVLKRAMRGMIAAVMLGFSRALGETIAVLMVVGNVPAIPKSLFDPAYPLPALLANNYGEMMSIPLYESALMMSALVLLTVVLGVNVLARVALTAARNGAR